MGVCAATRRQVETLYLDEPKLAFARRIFTQGEARGFFLCHLPDVDGAIFPDDAVGKLNGCLNLFFRRSIERDINF